MDTLGIEEKLDHVKEKLDRMVALLEQLIKLQGGVARPQPVKVPEPKPKAPLITEDSENG